MSPQERGAHTPGPWFAHVENADSGEIEIKSARRPYVCTVHPGGINGVSEANARMIAAAPDLLAAQAMGAELNTPDFLDWIADRLVHVHGENPNVDYVQTLRNRANAGRAAIAKATGTQP